MKKFENILICSDIDGTLLNSNRQISNENLEAIEYFKSEGGYFTIITGRPPAVAEEICKQVRPNAPIGCINGGGLYDFERGEYVHLSHLDRSAAELAEYACSKFESLGYQINTAGPVYFCRDNYSMEWFRKITGTPFIQRAPEMIEEPFTKIVFGDQNEDVILALDKLLRAHPNACEFDLVSSEPTLYEILPRGTHKGKAIPALCEYLSLPIERCIAIGDYNNDVEMLRAAGVGIAVANASAEAIAAADRVTVSNDDHAIACVIADIESRKIQLL